MPPDPMSDTLQSMAGYLGQYVPECPLGLRYKMIRDGYRALLDFPTDGWSFQYGTGNFITYQSLFGSCTAIQGQTLVQNCVPTQGMGTVSIANGGSAYGIGDLLYPIGFSGGVLTVATLNGSAVATATITNAGANFTISQNVATQTNNAGTGCTVNVLTLGNGQLPGDRTTIVGRQVLFGGEAPIYSIVDNQSGSSFVLEQAYGGTTGSVGFEITNIYFTPKDMNFGGLMSFADPPNGCQYPYSFTFEELNNVDAQRSSAGTPYLLADTTMNDYYLSQLPAGVTDSFGYSNTSTAVPRKELYPRNQANYVYPYFYRKWIPDLVNPASTPINFFARRGDIIRTRAMADLSMWTGPAVLGRQANPVAHNIHMAEFQKRAQELQIKDQSIMQRSFSMYLSMTRLPFPAAFWGSSFSQLHPELSNEVGVQFNDFLVE